MSKTKLINSFNYIELKPKVQCEDISSSTLSASPRRISNRAKQILDSSNLSKPLNCPKMHLKTIRILEKNIIKREDHSSFKQNIPNTSLCHLHSPEIFNENNIKVESSFRCRSKIFTLCYYSPIQN